MPGDCIFCKIATNEFDTEFLYESDEIVAFRDLNPKAPVHVLIIPKRHIEKISDTNESDALLLGKMINVANIIAETENIKGSGFRLVFNCGKDGGQEVYHIHLHLLGGRSLTWPPG